MTIYHRILVPIDGSATSASALKEAIRLAEGKALIHLAYVLEDVYMLDTESQVLIDYAAMQETARNIGEQTLSHAADKVRQSGATVETLLLEARGESIAALVNEDAGNWQADLIVIGTHGRTGLSRLLMGSVAEGVVRGASIPVLLVRTE